MNHSESKIHSLVIGHTEVCYKVWDWTLTEFLTYEKHFNHLKRDLWEFVRGLEVVLWMVLTVLSKFFNSLLKWNINIFIHIW